MFCGQKAKKEWLIIRILYPLKNVQRWKLRPLAWNHSNPNDFFSGFCFWFFSLGPKMSFTIKHGLFCTSLHYTRNWKECLWLRMKLNSNLRKRCCLRMWIASCFYPITGKKKISKDTFCYYIWKVFFNYLHTILG